MTYEIRTGDALEQLRAMPAESIHCCVTSPPYFGLRDYGMAGQIGLEKTLAHYIGRLVEVMEEVRRLLRPDGTMWLNLGDTYAGKTVGRRAQGPHITGRRSAASDAQKRPGLSDGFKHKDLMGIPWRVAFALQDAGWFLRADVIWHKPNPMPESVSDRPTRSHEYLFLLTKRERYFYDADAIREPHRPGSQERSQRGRKPGAKYASGNTIRGPQTMLHDMGKCCHPKGANKRSVWTIAPRNFKGAHFATFPETLVRPCILAGCPAGGVVLDPFTGSGTTGAVAMKLGRSFIGLELNPTYADMARQRVGEAYRQGVQQTIAGVA
jgi:DNA modification methylase